MGLQQHKDLEEKTEFLGNILIFKNWGHRALQSLLDYFLTKRWTRKQVLYKEGDKTHDVYIIRSGEVKCSKIIRLNSINDKKSMLLDEKSQVYSYDEESLQKMIEVILILLFN